MKFKYFLRGFGTGIIFAAIICLVAFQSEDSRNISDKEVIERAKALGMVEKDDSIEDMFNTEDAASEKKDESKKKSAEKDTSEASSVSEKTEENTTDETTEEQTTEKQTTEKKTTEAKTTESTTEKHTTEASGEKEKNTNKKITITIRGGMSSYPVCQMLQDAGVIEDASDFDNYLIKNGYANRISVGTHTLTIGMTYQEIAVAISDPE